MQPQKFLACPGRHLLPSRRLDLLDGELVDSLGITSQSEPQVSVMANDPDAQVEVPQPTIGRRTESFVGADALVRKLRENGRVVTYTRWSRSVSTPRATASSWAWT